MAFEAMFEPIQIGKLTIRNRVLSTAHAEVYATDGGMTTERYVQYYEEKAKGGIGLDTMVQRLVQTAVWDIDAKYK